VSNLLSGLPITILNNKALVIPVNLLYIMPQAYQGQALQEFLDQTTIPHMGVIGK
jgi:hypothetical protein